jgi:hypothetical protein
VPPTGMQSPPGVSPAGRGGRGRHRPAPRVNGNWSNAQLQVALTAHERGRSVSGATALYGIPRSSFRAHLAGTVLSRKRGATGVLTEVEEQELVQQLKLKVAIMTQGRDTPFTDGILGTSWLCWFKRRHAELSLRLAQDLDAKRARSLCADNVRTFYENLTSLYA